MPARAGRLARAGAQGVCSVLLIVFGIVIVLPGVIIIAFQDDVNNTWGIVGMCVLGFGAVCLIIGIWMCLSCVSLCCKTEERRRVVSVEREGNGQHRRKRGKKSSQTSASTAQSSQVGYLPPNPGTRPTSGGYLPMNPLQGYNLGPSNSPAPTSPIPLYPPSQPYPAVSNPGQLPIYPPQSCYPGSSNAPLPPSPGHYYASAQPHPAVSVPGPMPVYPALSSDNLPYNPQFIAVTSSSQSAAYIHPSSSASASAPPQDDQNIRPPTYDEAMSVSKI